MSEIDNSFRYVVSCRIDDEDYDFEFDVVKNASISERSSLTTHPLVNGDVIGDHLFREPTSITIDGTFSLNGNKPTNFQGNGSRLYNIQQTFRRIKNEGIKCRIVKTSKSDNIATRFSTYENMVLTGIRWTEKQNSLGFSFNFVEVLSVDVEEVSYEVDVTDENLPAITDAMTLDFTDTLLDWDEIDKIVLNQLINVELISSEFLQGCVETALKAWGGLVVGGVIGEVVGVTLIGFKVLLGIGVASAGVPIIGWIAVGVIGVIGAIAGAIIAAYNSIKKHDAQRKYKIKAFKLYKDDRKNQAEFERFASYIGSIHQNLEYLENSMKVYGISSNEEQECMVYIDDDYYIFTFKKNNTSLKYGLNITNSAGKVLREMNELNGFRNIGECTEGNYLFKTDNGYYVYLINLKLEQLINSAAHPYTIDEANNDLTNYVVFVTQINMSNFNKTLNDIIVNAMTV